MVDDRGQRPSQNPDAPRASVAIKGAPMIQGELKLEDGSVLSIIVVFPNVVRLEGQHDAIGAPMYELQSTIVMGVKSFERGH